MKPTPTKRALGLVLLAAALLPLCAARAGASAISYSLTFCEDLEVLKDPMNKTLAMNQAWKPQHSLMMQRTMPYFELRNTSEEAAITQFSMSIGDVSKNFDLAKLIEASPGVSFSLVTPDEVMGGAKSDQLIINFASLDPGEFVRFRVGLSADAPGSSLIQDYRMILFHLDGNDPSNNSQVTVNFSGANGSESLTQQMPNYTMGGMYTSTDLAMPHSYRMDMIMPFSLTGDGFLNPQDPEDPGDPGEGPQVPEPASGVLLAAGLLGLAAWRVRRRR